MLSVKPSSPTRMLTTNSQSTEISQSISVSLTELNLREMTQKEKGELLTSHKLKTSNTFSRFRGADLPHSTRETLTWNEVTCLKGVHQTEPRQPVSTILTSLLSVEFPTDSRREHNRGNANRRPVHHTFAAHHRYSSNKNERNFAAPK